MANVDRPRADALRAAPTAPIDRTPRIWPHFMLPMLVTIVVILGILLALPALRLNCDTNHLLEFMAIAFSCAMVGGIIGGGAGIVFDIPALKRFGAQTAFTAVGGFGAFIIGFPLAYVLLPKCASWSSLIRIDAINLAPPSDKYKRPAFVALSIQRHGDGENEAPYWKSFENTDDASIQLTLPSDWVKLTFTGFALVDGPAAGGTAPAINYQFLGTCEIEIKSGAAPKDGPENVTAPDGITYRLLPFKTEQIEPGKQLRLRFRASYFDELGANRDTNPGFVPNQCLQGEFYDKTDPSKSSAPSSVRLIPPLLATAESSYLVLPRLRYAFNKPIPIQGGDPNINAARADIPVKEIVGAPGAQPSASQPEATVPGPAPAHDSPLEKAAACIQVEGLRKSIVAYLGGSDLDNPERNRLYNGWTDIACLPVHIINDTKIDSGDKNSLSSGIQARAVRLLASTIINNDGETPPTKYWQPGGHKRDFTRPLPGYFNALRARIFSLLNSDDDSVRAEAIRLVKLVPNDQFESLFVTELDQGGSRSATARKRYAIAATALYYNRIVEWLNVSDGDKAAQKSASQIQVKADFLSGSRWMQDAFFAPRGSKPFLAMLFYAKGIVEHEIGSADDAGKASFARMIATLNAIDDPDTNPYPSRALHIAQALVLSSSLDTQRQAALLKPVHDAVELDFGRFSEGPSFGDGVHDLFIAPVPTAPHLATRIDPHDRVRLMLQATDWFLVSAKGKLGWVHNVPRS